MIRWKASPRVWAVAVVTLAVVLIVPASARADTRDDLERARDRVRDAQEAADELAARYEAAVVEHARVVSERDRLQARVEATEVRMREVRSRLQQIAVDAYVGRGATPDPVAWIDADDVLSARRQAHILDLAAAPQNAVIAEYEALRDDLEHDRDQLAVTEARAVELVTAMEAEADRLQAELTDAQATHTALEREVAREEAARSRLLAFLRSARTTTTTTTVAPTTTTPSPTTTAAPDRAPAPPPVPEADPAPPPGGSDGEVVCPIRGAVSFVDSWGAPRSGGRRHQGVDLMAVAGTPNVAVVSGEIRQKEGRLSGLGVYLHGDDGNSYWYFHLSAYEGSPRRVAQGEVVGYVGSSGNADVSAPHTHFEYHPGGGAAVNPYPLVRAAC